MKFQIFAKLYKNLISTLSFSSELRKMRRELNAKIDMPDTISPGMHAHALGVNRWFKKRRVSIAESYLMVVSNLDSKYAEKRLDALRVLADVAFHSKNLDYPLNTARVQMALIKGVVKNRNNKRRQLELLHDFTISSRGQHQVLARLCDELNIIELPEQGLRLEDFGYGWDSHVHDTATTGRKNATQLIIDAFIKGISELTCAYGSADDIATMEEVLEAGSILGIRIHLGIEFSMEVMGKRGHFMALLPDSIKTPADVRAFFAANEATLKEFFDGLATNQLNRMASVRQLFREFNQTYLVELNEGFSDSPLFKVPELTLESLQEFIPTVSIHRLHIAEYPYNMYKPILQNRLLHLKVLRAGMRQGQDRKKPDSPEFRKIDKLYSALKKEVKNLTPDILMERYFSGPRIIDYTSVFKDIEKLKSQLAQAGCRLKILHPLEFGLDDAEKILTRYRGIIDEVELFSTQDCIGRKPEEIEALAIMINRLNAQDGPPLVPVCGSDSTGRNPHVPGMGFIFEDKIIGVRKKRYVKRHMALPPMVSAMVNAKGRPVSEEDILQAPVIISMGKISTGKERESQNEVITPWRAFRYLNPMVKNIILVSIGFLVADSFIGWGYALLWLAITGFRNSIADLISTRGTKLNEWKIKSINFDNVVQSLFWTGFSVPILGFVKSSFDSIWPGVHDGLAFNLVKFFFISFANGLYLATHNTLRGFDRKVVRLNFFRSVLAWPFATIFAPVGNLIGIPSIVQTKIWSDFIAGFIEGGNKYLKVLRLRRQNLEEIIPLISDADESTRYAAMLDLLYLFREEPRTKSSLRAIFDPAYKPLIVLKGYVKPKPQGYEAFKRAIFAPDLAEKLSLFILSQHEAERAEDLANLAADTLPALRAWLESKLSAVKTVV
ncbi:MAG: hypothetical protein LWX00_05240 [Spirochaetia bacterium]|nr:hypothetical protein [Spirochaetia bacterium]